MARNRERDRLLDRPGAVFRLMAKANGAYHAPPRKWGLLTTKPFADDETQKVLVTQTLSAMDRQNPFKSGKLLG